jgi:hypothetical protein
MSDTLIPNPPIDDNEHLYNTTDTQEYNTTNIMLYSLAGLLCVYSLRMVLCRISNNCINNIQAYQRKNQLNDFLISREENHTDESIEECNEEGQDECTICLEGFSTNQINIRLPCNHKFHTKCILQWFEKELICPNCRAPLDLR